LTTQNITFGLIAIGNKVLQLDMWNSVWRLVVNLPMNSLCIVFCLLKITNIVMMWNF